VTTIDCEKSGECFNFSRKTKQNTMQAKIYSCIRLKYTSHV